MVVPREIDTKATVGNSFHACRNGSESAVQYATGELTTAVGDFLVDGENLIAVAQGTQSQKSLVRLFKYTPTTIGTHKNWTVVAQFQPLDDAPNANNANGGVSLDAADVDGDGLDELIVGQTSSASSLTQYTVIDVAADGKHVRHNHVAFPAGFRGDGGVNAEAADINGDGSIELVFTSKGIRESGDTTNLVTVVRPVVTGNVVTGFERPGGSVVSKLLDDAVNPGGGLSVSAGELDGDTTNGAELLIGSGKGAPQSFWRVVKLSYDGTDVTGYSYLIGPPKNITFIKNAFDGAFNPTSGAVNVEAANHTVRQ
jgi:hypothetical protein